MFDYPGDMLKALRRKGFALTEGICKLLIVIQDENYKRLTLLID